MYVKTDVFPAKLMHLASYASAGVAIVLISVKLLAWILTDSTALLSSLVDSFLDAAASCINMVAIQHTLQPADPEHRFGHGKAESLAELGQSAFIAGSAVFLGIQAISYLFKPTVIHYAPVGICVIAFSTVLTFILIIFQRFVIRQTGSVAINADSLHYLSDLLVNGVVIIALGITWSTEWNFIDPLFALIVTVYILYTAEQMMRHSLNLLMDREFPEQARQRIRDIVSGEAEVIDMHDLRTRSSGLQDFIQFHLELDYALHLYQAHEVVNRVEWRLREAFPTADIIIHEDPSNLGSKGPI